MSRAARLLREQLGDRAAVDVGLVLGPGLGALAEDVVDAVAVPYGELPGLPMGGVPGDAGRLVLGSLAGARVAVLQGRAHLYEGIAPALIREPIRPLRTLGAHTVVLTNAADSLRPEVAPGRLMAIADPINVCLMPAFVELAGERRAGTAVRVATVGNFPAGAADAAGAARETADAVSAGAQEVDVVAPWRAWLAGDRDCVRALVVACRDACAGRAHLKVILETGSLPDADCGRALASLAIEAGPDFVKTSTGKIGPGASPDAAGAVPTAVRDSESRAGFKAAGGIRTTAQAGQYLALADELLGPAWAPPDTFRLDASSLLDDLLAHA